MLNRKFLFLLITLPLLFAGCFSANKAPRESSYTIAGYDFINSGISFMNMGEYGDAKSAFERAFEQFSLIDDSDGKIDALLYLIRVYSKTGEKDKTEAVLARLQSLGLTDGPKLLRAKTEAAFSEGEYQNVISLCEPELAKIKLQPFSEDNLDIMSYYINAGNALGLKISGGVLADYKDLIVIATEKHIDGSFGNPLALSFAYYTLALTYYNMKEYQNSHTYFTTALELDKNYENLPGIADDLYMKGKTLVNLKRFTEALDHLERAADAFKALGKTGDYDHAMVDIMSLRPDKMDVSYLTALLVNSKDEALKEKIRKILKPME